MMNHFFTRSDTPHMAHVIGLSFLSLLLIACKTPDPTLGNLG